VSEVDKHLDKAFASLDDLTVRELEATAEAIGSSDTRCTSSPASSGALLRPVRGAGARTFPRFHLRDNVSRADEELARRIADARAPFWRHVRDALAERRP
jgi:hypothetical protein